MPSEELALEEEERGVIGAPRCSNESVPRRGESEEGKFSRYAVYGAVKTVIGGWDHG